MIPTTQAANVPTNKRQIEQKVDEIETAVTQYYEVVDELYKRLDAVIRKDPEPPSDCCEKEHLVPLADALDIQASRIRHLNYRITSLLQLLEV